MAVVLDVSPKVLARAFELTLRPWPSQEALVAELRSHHYLSPWAQNMIRVMPTVEAVTTVRVVPVTARDVDAVSFVAERGEVRKKRIGRGMARCYRRTELYEVFQARGFLLCHPQIGPELELSHPSDLDLQYVRIAMEPIDSGLNLPGIFHRRPEFREVGLCADAGGNIVEFSETSRWLVQLP